MEIKTEGIILRVIPFKETHRIVTLFSQEAGIISLLAKKISTPEKLALLSPFSRIEVIYRKGHSELFSFKDGTLLSHHLFLREKWDYMENAGKMAQAILQSQLPGKPAPLLYSLLISCLKQLPYFEQPSTLLLIFYLKLLTHEGHISWEDPSHFPLPPDQWTQLKELAHIRSFQQLRQQKGLEMILKSLERKLKDIL